jgi:tetratricopeptide (TPR) repeat protein
MRILFNLCLLFPCLSLFAQPNCEAYKYFGDALKYKACKVSEKRAGHYQFSREYQEALDEALEIDSTFAFAYKVKSTAYLKSGDFLNWKKLIDLAVKYDTVGHLDYRGWCRYQFFRDYTGAIADIELLDKLVDHDIGYSVNGDYHLQIARALCYKALGQNDKAIQIIETQFEDPEYPIGLYDCLHLGVLYLEKQEYDKALHYFAKQAEENDLAENRYYSALAHKLNNNPTAYEEELILAHRKYQNEERMNEDYTEYADKIHLRDFENALKLLGK